MDDVVLLHVLLASRVTHSYAHGFSLAAGVLSPKWLYFSLYDAVSGVLPTLAELIECAELDDFLANKVGYTVRAEFWLCGAE